MPLALSLNLNAVVPTWFVALVGVALVLLLVHGSRLLRRKNVPPNWVGVLAVLRAVIIVVFVVTLLQPVVSCSRTAEQAPDLILLIDTSRSMNAPASAEGRTRFDAARAALRAGNFRGELGERFSVRYFAFDRDARPVDGDAGLDGLVADGTAT